MAAQELQLIEAAVMLCGEITRKHTASSEVCIYVCMHVCMHVVTCVWMCVGCESRLVAARGVFCLAVCC